jgi:hypothetical protein
LPYPASYSDCREYVGESTIRFDDPDAAAGAAAAAEHNGVEQALDLRPMGDGVFIFRERGNLVLDRTFHSEWETH